MEQRATSIRPWLHNPFHKLTRDVRHYLSISFDIQFGAKLDALMMRKVFEYPKPKRLFLDATIWVLNTDIAACGSCCVRRNVAILLNHAQGLLTKAMCPERPNLSLLNPVVTGSQEVRVRCWVQARSIIYI